MSDLELNNIYKHMSEKDKPSFILKYLEDKTLFTKAGKQRNKKIISIIWKQFRRCLFE